MSKPDDFDYTVSTGKDLEHWIADVTTALKEEGFGVLGILDFRAVLKQRGVELGRDYRLMEVCNPRAANTALSLSGISRPSSLMTIEVLSIEYH